MITDEEENRAGKYEKGYWRKVHSLFHNVNFHAVGRYHQRMKKRLLGSRSFTHNIHSIAPGLVHSLS